MALRKLSGSSRPLTIYFEMFVEHDRCNMKLHLDCDNEKFEKDINFIQESQFCLLNVREKHSLRTEYAVTIDGRVTLFSSEAGASGSSQSLD